MYIDIHCHPGMKPFGKSFKKKETSCQNSADPTQENSIWYRDEPSSFDKDLNRALTVTKFTQGDFTTLAKGNVKVISASLYPLEKGFVKTRLGSGLLPDALLGFVIGLSKDRLDLIDDMPDYYSDLVVERDFYKQLHDKETTLEEGKFKYRIVKNFEELKANIESKDENVISVFFSIEGGHVFNCGLDSKKDVAINDDVLKNVSQIKSWEFRPLFITLAHHFYNELCGHAKRLEGITATLLNQKRKMNTQITDLGLRVIDQLLDNTHNNRIYIDVKHMCAAARYQYYDLLDTNYRNEDIPIVASHGAMNGLIGHKNKQRSGYATSGKFMKEAINFYDEEVIKIAESGGIIGLQLDERRVASKAELRSTRKKEGKNERKFYRSLLFWNHIQHAGEVLNDAGLDAWNTLSLGTDYDGIIDPLNEFWTATELDELKIHLKDHASTYMNLKSEKFLPKNKIDPDEIIDRIMFGNTYNFLNRYFN